MARKTAIGKAIEALEEELRATNEQWQRAQDLHDARHHAICAAIDLLRKETVKRPRKPKAVTPQTAA